MKVYIVTKNDPDATEILKVFLDKDKALSYREKGFSESNIFDKPNHSYYRQEHVIARYLDKDLGLEWIQVEVYKVEK